jgi:hypothetical protein
MNRHARRAAKARARKQGSGYMMHLHRALAGLDLTKSGHTEVTVEHEGGCGYHRGRSCNCVPILYRRTDGNDTVETIDRAGRVTVSRRN